MRFPPYLLIIFALSWHASADDMPDNKFLSFWKLQKGLLTSSRINTFRKKCFPVGDLPAVDKSFCKQTGEAAKNLSTLLSEISGESVSSSRALSCVDGIPDDVSDLSGIFKRLEAKDDCDELSPGEFKLNHFLLERKANSNYLATVNILFKRISGNKTPDEMLSAANKCLHSVTPFMKTADDRTLEIRVLSPEQVEQNLPFEKRPPQTVINIVAGVEQKEGSGPTSFRDNSENFADTTPCSTFVHEFLHHLGLSDEYKETSDELAAPWACRVVPKTNTIMSQSQLFFNSVVPQKLVCSCNTAECSSMRKAVESESEDVKKLFGRPNIIKFMPHNLQSHCRPVVKDPVDLEPDQSFSTLQESTGKILFEYRSLLLVKSKAIVLRVKMDCDCSGDKVCLDSLKEFKLSSKRLATSCPWGMELKNSSLPARAEESGLSEDGVVIILRPTSLRSLITPKQWGKILTGNCKSGSGGEYRSCERFAYMSEKDPLCKVPTECRSDEFYLGVDEPEH